MVGRMPTISTEGLRFSRTIASVFSSWTSPRSDRYSVCTGTITPVPATKALIVSRPVEGDQEHAMAVLGERDAEVERRGRLRNAALLVREDEHLRLRRRRHVRRAN